MSAICGIYLLDRNDRPDLPRSFLDKMVQTMARRGPDRSGFFLQGCVGLGHAMLSTTPESLGEILPYTSESGATITSDARIDNREELIPQLGLREDVSDSRIIVRAYEMWGSGCVEKLLGDFAFAIWDETEGKLFCARDHMGARPFFYCYLSNKAFVFASEIKAILSLPWVPRCLNESMVANFLVPILDDREVTFYQGIYRLPAAHTMIVDFAGQKMRRYWSLGPDKKIEGLSDEEYADKFLRIFQEAVSCRVRSVFPVGSTLSGGLDSSSVACIASMLLTNRNEMLSTFSAVFPDAPKSDERRYIEAVLGKGGMESHYIRGDLLSPLGCLEEASGQMDEPPWIPNFFWEREIYRFAQMAGVRVMLDGFDGDTAVSHGFTYLAELARSARWRELHKEVKGISRNFRVPVRRILLNLCVMPLIPEAAARMWRKVRRGTRRDIEREIFHPDFYEIAGVAKRIEAFHERFCGTADLRADHCQALEDGFIQYVMEMLNLQAGAFSIEICHPFFDKRLIEFCLALPPNQKLRLGWSRWVLRSAMMGILPEEVRMRKDKANLSHNFRRGFLNYDEEALKKLISGGYAVVEDYIDIQALHKICQRIGEGVSDKDVLDLWKIAVLTHWISKIRCMRLPKG